MLKNPNLVIHVTVKRGRKSGKIVSVRRDEKSDMQGRISNIRIELTCEQQDVLNSWLRKSTTPAGLAKRARAVLMLASGETFNRTSEYVGMGERLVLDNLSVHKGKKVQAWLVKHPRFVFHHLPVHCSWMNQVEQWFSILQRKRLKISADR